MFPFVYLYIYICVDGETVLSFPYSLSHLCVAMSAADIKYRGKPECSCVHRFQCISENTSCHGKLTFFCSTYRTAKRVKKMLKRLLECGVLFKKNKLKRKMH